MGVETWMPLYPADVLASCSDMSPAQFGSYMRLLCYAWQSGGVPNDMEAACRIAGGCTPADWAVVRKRLVVLDEGTSAERLSHARLEAERSKAVSLHAKRQAALEEGRRKRAEGGAHAGPHVSPHVSPHTDAHPATPIPSPLPSPSPVFKNESPTEILRPTRQKPRQSKPRSYRVSWAEDGGFHGILDSDIANWKAAYPSVDLTVETAKAHAWLVANPADQGKKNWLDFLNRWFARSHRFGGTPGRADRQPAPPQKTFRTDAGQAMTASEYAAWKRARDRDEYVKAKARKRTGGLTSLGDIIDERPGSSAS